MNTTDTTKTPTSRLADVPAPRPVNTPVPNDPRPTYPDLLAQKAVRTGADAQ